MEFDSPYFLAPLAGINDIAFRRLCRECGAGLVFTGMVNGNAAIRKNKATLKLMQTCKEEMPCALQLFGTKPETLLEAARMSDAPIIDINMGCPDKNVIKQGAGAALLKRPSKIGEITSYLANNLQKPVTVKIRSGYDRCDLPETIRIAKIIEESKAAAITIHPRTVVQAYRGEADWEVIAAVKKAVSIPVIGNGDCRSLEDAEVMRRRTGCDYVMIGRAAIGNPGIFAGERRQLFRKYLEYCELYGIDKIAYLRMQGQFFTKGFSGASRIREKMGRVDNMEELIKLSEMLSQ
ncbi:MAG: tRNA dihydrouridine synthase [Candidatus Woesearchaeota archaeon]